MTAPPLTAAALRSLLEYDPGTGEFRWKPRPGMRAWNTRYAGRVAGYDWTIGRVSYRCIRVLDWPFLAHRLAWLYVTGEWPRHGVDHRDMDGLNNRWSNLREATKIQNAHNVTVSRRNSTGFKGVSLIRKSGKFRAYLSHSGRQLVLGYFDTAEAASAAYAKAAIELRGEFARVA